MEKPKISIQILTLPETKSLPLKIGIAFQPSRASGGMLVSGSVPSWERFTDPLPGNQALLSR